MSKTKTTYMHVVNGNKVTEEVYKKLDKVEQSFYDKVSSLRKAKKAVDIIAHQEEEEGYYED